MRPPAIILLAMLGGCATASHDERSALLNQPITCATAEADIAALEAALPSRGERARSVVQSVTPVGVATGVVTGSYSDRASVLTGATEDELRTRIDEIETACGLADADTTTSN
ncbi:MAG: hypothetical protein AAFQ21_00315 [Pseudomonadota bacterium]